MSLALLWLLLCSLATAQDYPDPSFQDAEIALQSGDLDRARKHLERGLKKVPDHANAWADLGNVHLLQERPDDAISAFESALAVDANHYVAMNGMGVAYLKKADRVNAIEWFLRSVEANGAYATPLVNLGDVGMAMGRLAEAIVYYDLASQADPGNKRAAIALADIHIAAGVPDQALRYVQAALSRAPRDVDLLLSLASVYQAMNEDRLALDRLAAAKELDPGRREVHRYAGLSFLKLAMWPEAEAAYRAALELDSEDRDVHFELSQVYGLSGQDVDRAMDHLGYALQLDPGFYPAMALRGDLLEEIGDIEGAVNAWDQVLVVAPGHCPTLNNLGRRRMVDGDYVAAALHFSECLAADPAFHAARLNRGACRAKAGDCRAAQPDLEAVARLGGTLGAQAEALLAECH